MQGRRSFDMLLSIGEQSEFSLEQNIREEVEMSLQSLQPTDIEDFEEICKFNEEIKELTETMMKGTDLKDLKKAVTKLTSAAKMKEFLTDEDPPEEREKLERKIAERIDKIKLIIRRREERAHAASALVAERYLDQIGREFNLPPKTLQNLKKELLGGLAALITGTFGLIGAVFGIVSASSTGGLVVGAGAGAGAAGVGLGAASGGLSAVALILPIGLGCVAAAFLLIGIRVLIQKRKEDKRYQAYKKFCEKMLRIREQR